MITASQIQSVADKIAKQFRPERITLFGSYAYGTPNENSDVDLLVVMPFEGRKSAQAIEIRRAVYDGFAIDLLYVPAVLIADVPLGTGQGTFFTRWGDWLAYLCVLADAIVLAVILRRKESAV